MTGALKGEEKVEEGEMKMMMMELLLDADGAACCRLLQFLPERGTFLMLVFMMAAVIHSFKKSLGANLISHLLLLTFSSCFSLIIFLTLFSATKYITLNMYVYITGS